VIRKNTIVEIDGERYFVLETYGGVTSRTMDGRFCQSSPPDEVILRRVEKLKDD